MLTVHELRDRSQRFDFAAALAEIIVGYTMTDPGPDAPYPDAPQLLVPNLQGVAFTRLLGRSARFRNTEGESAVKECLPCWVAG